MILFRCREWGTSEWTEIAIRTPEEANEPYEELLAVHFREHLGRLDCHAQELVEVEQEGLPKMVWEDL